MNTTNNLRITEFKPLLPPQELITHIPISDHAAQVVTNTREQITNILSGKDDRLLVIVGPCSIHDPKAAIDYAQHLYDYAQQHAKTLCIIMRVYFEKPRTTVGWKGLINDPALDGTFDINVGLKTARQLLLQINELGMPAGSEFLDTIIPQYIADLVSWSAIGARTTESQIHRELASGLSMPVGFKNGTTGNIKIAIDAVYAASQPHHFLGVNHEGVASIISTTGNTNCHVILRGSNTGPNYTSDNLNMTTAQLTDRQLQPKLMIDCSHGNSNKDYKQQAVVVNAICEALKLGNRNIFGVMLESNLVEGKQAFTNTASLTYGKSITDACIGWEETKLVLEQLAQAVQQQRRLIE